jgi:hypothetical protein
MEAIAGIFAAPTPYLQEIIPKAAWRTTLAVVTTLFFILIWLGGCWTDLSQGLKWWRVVGPALISPIVVGLVSLGTTTILYFLNLILSGGETPAVKFKTLYSINIHCSLIFLLGEFLNFLLVRSDILSGPASPVRGRFPLGLDVFLLVVNDPSLYLSIVLHSTSVFVIWYLVVLSLGIRLATGISPAKAAIIAIAMWCVLVFMALGAAYAAGGETTIRLKL